MWTFSGDRYETHKSIFSLCCRSLSDSFHFEEHLVQIFGLFHESLPPAHIGQNKQYYLHRHELSAPVVLTVFIA